jgi:RNA polymerase sigma-B factor
MESALRSSAIVPSIDGPASFPGNQTIRARRASRRRRRAGRTSDPAGRRAPSNLPREPDGSPAVDPVLWAVHVRHAAEPSETTLTALVEAYDGYVRAIAHRMRGSGEPVEDLVQVAFEALLVAIERFDPARSVPFKGFATPSIEGSIKRHFRDHGWALRVPRRVHELAGPVRGATERLTAELAREPTDAEVAAKVGASPGSVTETRLALRARSMRSLDQPTLVGGVVLEPNSAPDRELVRTENRLALSQAVEQLSGQERDLLDKYYLGQETQSEIAEVYGVSQMQVSRWLAHATNRLRQAVQVA